MDADRNYGDLLSPVILKEFGIEHRKGEPESHDAIMVGSIAKFARPGTLVLGSGFIRHADPVCVTADWRWVRGPLTRDKVRAAGGKVGDVLGDPAMLLPRIWPKPPTRHALGIVPHYVDRDIARMRFPNERIIDLVTNDPARTTQEIAECAEIISSSLHGLVVAHAYGIPAAWVPLSDRLYGDGFKFQDHYAALGLTCEPSSIEAPVFSVSSIDLQPMIEVLEQCKTYRF